MTAILVNFGGVPLTCVFFGHKGVPNGIESKIREIVVDLIKRKNVNCFLVGNEGGFDCAVQKVLNEIVLEYNVKFDIVFAYMPKEVDCNIKYENTIYPEILGGKARSYSIPKRNMWMLKQADFVVVYVWDITGNAARLEEKAKQMNKEVINIAKL